MNKSIINNFYKLFQFKNYLFIMSNNYRFYRTKKNV